MDHRRLLLTVLAAISLAMGACTSAVAQETVAADRFVDSVGTNIHLHYDRTPYRDQFGLVRQRLQELGVRHVRDGLVDTQWQGYYDRHNLLGEMGIKGTFIIAPDASVSLMADYPRRMHHTFEAYEAPNELDKSDDPNWAETLRRSLARMKMLDDIPEVTKFPVYGPSLTRAESIQALGDVSPFVDFLNMHNYFAGRNPGTPGWGSDGYGSIDWNIRTIRRPSSDKPVVTTETGYQDHASQTDNVPAVVVGRYLPRVLLEQYRAGVVRTFIYELFDFTNSGHYGLLNTDGSAKPAFNAMKSLLHLLNDPGDGFEPQPLAYTIDGAGNDLRHMAFARRDGTYLLALWVEAPCFDMQRRAMVNVATQSVTVKLGESMRIVKSHRWQASGDIEATEHMTTASSMAAKVTDALMMIELAPRQAGDE